jgi:superfamily II DNA helicase RecQ
MSNSKVLCNDECQAWKSGGLSNACTAQIKLTDALHCYYGFTSFRPGQLEALLPMAHGRDMFVRMPTGGKTVPCAIVSCDAMGIIISPLVGLIQQQVRTFLVILFPF